VESTIFDELREIVGPRGLITSREETPHLRVRRADKFSRAAAGGPAAQFHRASAKKSCACATAKKFHSSLAAREPV